MTKELTVVVLAAGGGTRMKSKTMKVLHRIGGRSMVGHVLTAVQAMEPHRVVAVVGTQREQVGPHILEHVPDAVLAVQESLDGTGDAVRVALAAVGAQVTGTVVVVTGDTPLLQGESLRAFAEEHDAAERAVSILTGRVPNPFGYGRIIRNAEGDVEGIVEEKDATPAQREIDEINSGILAFDAAFLRDALGGLTNDNAGGEYYLTDTVRIARDAGLTVGAHVLDDVRQTEGANDRVQLAALGRELNRRIVEEWMRAGVTVMDPATTWIEADVVLEPDVTILPGCQLLGATLVREDAVVGPDSTLKDCEIGAGARVVRTHGELAVVGDEATVGPFSYLRPGTTVGTQGKIGAFVETKNAQIGDRSKVPHLSYVGDAEIGTDANIGAGTIFANYDGERKHRTTVGDRAKTGSNNTFIAPVAIGDDAMTGGGTTVRRDVPDGALAVSASPQRNLPDWKKRRAALQEGTGA
ncbi:bifunctional UDP-N-acetylglucosamine diphosphorylase/glucosamine-1-phosphate N-acetyltransferase GlmU [Nocardioides daejeonensis]|uniref:bifunctional UDP-N-acetylglucosamine diphosphorylase/glucosamine-1-phosphate N-acetyltransferase GlmU n=1 Tax=Nocardioides daejeonensis TaxID=1046556 RepID=UPI000D745B1A|nr:bifunctional UDP-N-acetylglucosamine diphosphorylase/glucosamine-1-phosphate N-acetyltransferase GlmU [Nocardioides daejeonensis]